MEDSGARHQAAMRQSVAAENAEWRMFYPVRAVIEGVRFVDQTEMKRTVVDCYVLDRTGRKTERGMIYNVPISYGKINADNGDEETPEKGDLVLIQFVNGNVRDPVVTHWLGPPNNSVQATSDQAPRRHRRRNGYDEVIDKGGNRIAYTPQDEEVTVDGQRVTVIEGNEDVTITSGDLLITVSAGKCTVNIAGKTAWTSEGTIELDGGSGSPKGVVQGDCVCPLVRGGHIMRSSDVKATLG